MIMSFSCTSSYEKFSLVLLLIPDDFCIFMMFIFFFRSFRLLQMRPH